MGFIYNDINIKDRRVKYAIDTLYSAMTDLLILDYQAQILINEASERKWIANHSTNEGDSLPLLPLGTEEVLNWNSLGFDLTSIDIPEW